MLSIAIWYIQMLNYNARYDIKILYHYNIHEYWLQCEYSNSELQYKTQMLNYSICINSQIVKLQYQCLNIEW